MSECILNLLPLTQEEKISFQSLAPHATHLYARRSAVTPQMLEQATVILGGPRPSDISLAKNLRWFHCMWAGLDDYLTQSTFPSDCLISNSSGTNAQAVSEHMLASLLALCRRIPEARDHQNRQQWYNMGSCKTICGATVLVVGAGNIGRRFGALCQGLGAHTIGLQRTPVDNLDGFHQVQTMDQLDILLPQADVVALCLPATAATDHIMDSSRFARMKSESIFMNAGRGNAVDQSALISALEEGPLWAATIDVTDPEPLPADHPLWRVPNLLLTPHCAGGLRLDVTRDNVVALVQENLRRYLCGETLINAVTL